MQFYYRIKKYSHIIKSFFGITSIAILTNANADTNMNFNFTSQISDDDYKTLAKTIINPTRFQFMSSPTPSAGKIVPLGISLGGGLSYLSIPQSTIDIINKYTDSANNFPSTVLIPRFIGKVGVPFGIDFAVNYAKIPQSSIELYGLAAQYVYANPKVVPITLAVRGGYTQISGFSPMSANSSNAELLLGIPLPIIKPYVGVGNNWSNANTSISLTGTLSNQTLSKSANWSETYAIIGVQAIALIGLDFEAQISSFQTIYNAKLSIEI
ncbi:hypothetical protein GCL60_13075 [Silvanigrella paludirubra]|uniref:Outer membrane beta-barrel protein n=1 Tax=Silvanigrella paludirubra TaxID=2499159 RepID=A0A6N6VR50_9BACT|nr:DUF6588 family protein [Silvanigrella paludirubra]KAB8036770.1 hypothetical protein GCL60_13075 [Silvanigrella paludirubra]